MNDGRSAVDPAKHVGLRQLVHGRRRLSVAAGMVDGPELVETSLADVNSKLTSPVRSVTLSQTMTL
ncbi:hypothetical protein H257_13744 [Aphanomyces astaci]|uniref:Uncharacterized protein n=1 Tax=Aphanomyces astaci TaxID=112090 RepID=W4FU86_APHAT|nr:hypothetical protein H257_13744 [Aphanomyces astaci]ETV71027.1 hypothetical protein H257_13744 [Aphanomyces astaci]|eukprot:XP_009839690.1 hypothetical protein H257_13744 [Aphanomyces astaci]